jgi:hypothetical protein
MSDYLWDKSGEPDPEIEALEKLLGPMGAKRDSRFAFPPRRTWIPMAIAASLLMAVGGIWLALHRNDHFAWQVSALAGTAQTARLGRGESLTTDAGSRARLEIRSVGQVEVEPNSQLSVMTLRGTEQRLDLKRGKISAMIWAPPGQFFVNTPSAVTVDLGCAYTLEVDSSGAGLVEVTAGWVAFENDGQESFIPATAACVTRPGKGPGIPYYEDASAALHDAVNRFDQNGDGTAVTQIVSEARPRDAITLWHLLRRVPVESRGPVFDRLAQLIHVPATVNRSGIVSGDGAMMDALWNSLDLGDTNWWRMWKTRIRASSAESVDH